MTERKQTVFKLCDRHEWLRSEGRIRMADFFAEDGPTDGPCVGDPCKIRPGLDLFIAEECRQQDWYDTAKGEHPFRWPVNAQKVRVVLTLEAAHHDVPALSLTVGMTVDDDRWPHVIPVGYVRVGRKWVTFSAFHPETNIYPNTPRRVAMNDSVRVWTA